MVKWGGFILCRHANCRIHAVYMQHCNIVLDVRILATEIKSAALAVARRGVHGEFHWKAFAT